MKYCKTIQNNSFCNGRSIDIYYNDISGQYHCDFADANEVYGTLGIFNDIEVQNDIYMLDVIDDFLNR